MTGATIPRKIEELRLDPAALPARWSYPLPASAPSEGRGGELANAYIDAAGVVVKRRLGGLPLTLSLTFDLFEGVAVRLLEVEGGLLARVELRHRDPALSVTLTVTRDMEAAAEDWRGWAERLRLPMLLTNADGSAERVGPATRTVSAWPLPRRRNATLAARRPRFLVRRKPGAAGPMPVLRGWSEIISYE